MGLMGVTVSTAEREPEQEPPAISLSERELELELGLDLLNAGGFSSRSLLRRTVKDATPRALA